MLSTVRDSGSSLLRVINDILDFSKIEANKLELEHVSLSIAEVVEGAAATVASTARARRVRFLSRIDPGVSPAVTGDTVRIRKILLNLLSNAIKFSEEGQVVLLSAEVVGAVAEGSQTVRFEVTDHGIGMSQDAQAKLFQPFMQVETSTTRKHGGTGLGLNICRQLSQLMSGGIEVHSVPGEGSVFTVTLPLPVADGAPPPVSVFDLAGLCVLFVHAHEFVRTAGIAYLCAAGCEVTAASVPDEAARLIDSCCAPRMLPEVVVMADEMQQAAAVEWHRQCAGHSSDRATRTVLARDSSADHEQVTPPANITLLDVNPMRRDALVYAVAIAAGRAQADTPSVTSG